MRYRSIFAVRKWSPHNAHTLVWYHYIHQWSHWQQWRLVWGSDSLVLLAWSNIESQLYNAFCWIRISCRWWMLGGSPKKTGGLDQLSRSDAHWQIARDRWLKMRWCTDIRMTHSRYTLSSLRRRPEQHGGNAGKTFVYTLVLEKQYVSASWEAPTSLELTLK